MRQQRAQRRVVEQHQAQQHRLEVEPVVVSGEEDAAFQQQDAEGADESRPPRAEDQERQDQLDDEHAAGGEAQQAGRQLRGMPGDRRRQRLAQEVIGQRRQVPPVGVAARQLDDARHEHEAEQQPAQQPDAGGPGDGQQQRGEAGLQQEGVPLEAGEDLPGVEQREIEHMEQDQAEARQQVYD